MEEKCLICSEKNALYKCSKCRVKYCSTTCYKTHTEQNDCTEIKTSPKEDIQNEYSYVTEDTIPSEKLKLLDQSSELKQILSNPHVRDILLDIDKSSNVEEIMDLAMKEPIFVEFADECLKVIENKDK